MCTKWCFKHLTFDQMITSRLLGFLIFQCVPYIQHQYLNNQKLKMDLTFLNFNCEWYLHLKMQLSYKLCFSHCSLLGMLLPLVCPLQLTVDTLCCLFSVPLIYLHVSNLYTFPGSCTGEMILFIVALKCEWRCINH